MRTLIDHIIHRELVHDKPGMNLIYFPYNNFVEYVWTDPTAQYYYTQYQAYDAGIKVYPNNYQKMKISDNRIPGRLYPDAIICNHKIQHLNKAKELSNLYHVPLIFIEHDLPSSDAKPALRQYINQNVDKDIYHVITDEIIHKEWCYADKNVSIIPYGIPEYPHAIKNTNICLIGDLDESDYSIIDSFRSSFPNIQILGQNRITRPYKTMQEITNLMAQSVIFVCLSGQIVPPILMLYAMANRCVVLANQSRWTSAWLENEKNGLVFGNVNEAKKIVRSILDDQDKIQVLQKNAHEFVTERFNQKEHIKRLEQLWSTVKQSIYKRGNINEISC